MGEMKADRDKSERVLGEVKKAMEKDAVVDVDEERVKLVIFPLGSELFSFRGDYIKEILLPLEITYVPGAAEHIMGIINVRGDIESVIALDKLLGLPAPESSDSSRILVAEYGDIRSGILVEGVEDVVDVPESSVKPPLSTITKTIGDYILGETEYRDNNVTVLDLEKIFTNFLTNED
jgi:purine-binding chemotaxis protein CheW